ncbi:Ubiquitin carboxyl-terminal hydrolase 48 [Entophlyctis luteolus]|nr:Ubiquitin carboxyl-terminal hydrolase 48 [Entophlyctis luteolus]
MMMMMIAVGSGGFEGGQEVGKGREGVNRKLLLFPRPPVMAQAAPPSFAGFSPDPAHGCSEESVKSLYMKGDYCPSPAAITSEGSRRKGKAAASRSQTCSYNKCKNNPNCLAGITPAKWLLANAESNFVRIADRFQPEESNIDQERPDGLPMGLKNLAATCYLNTLVQVWFHIPRFRQAVYDCVATDDGDMLKNLQFAFAYLQLGSRRVYDPTDYVKSLNIDSGVQQDAQEFSKLFLCALESLLSQQSSAEVASVIPNLFEGICTYITKCNSCGYESDRNEHFRDIEIIVSDSCTLVDSLANLYKVEELLDDENMWYCARCSSKQPATRRIALRETPPILQIQLLKFAFDVKKQKKLKVKAEVEFPEVLNMNPFLDSTKSQDLPAEYILSAILVHRGNSAYSGHFVAKIRDPKTHEWYEFNDEAVRKLKPTELDRDDDDKKKGKRVEDEKQSTSTERVLSSSFAYMLIYTHQKEWERGEKIVENCMPSTEVRDKIVGLNTEFVHVLKQKNERVSALKKQFDESKELRLKVSEKWRVSSDNDPCFYVHRNSLKLWMNAGIDASVLADDDGESESDEDTNSNKSHILDNSELLCPHSKLDHKLVQMAKRISKANWKKSRLAFPTPLPTEQPFIGDVCCDHGKLRVGAAASRVSKEALEFLTAILGTSLAGLPSTSEAECSACLIQKWEMYESKKDLIQLASQEKIKCKKLAENKSIPSTIPKGVFYLVPADPDSVCQAKFAILSPQDWSNFFEWYNANIIVEGEKIVDSNGAFYMKCDPAVCQICKTQRWVNSPELVIHVRQMSEKPTESNTNGLETGEISAAELSPSSTEKVANSESIGEKKRKIGPFFGIFSSPARHSKRLRDRREFEFKIDKLKTVLDVKTEISSKWGVPPVHQRLFLRSVELQDNSQTVQSLNVNRDDIFEVILMEEQKEFLDDDEGTYERELGFAGSSLVGRNHPQGQENVRDNEDNPNHFADEFGWDCRMCTFKNNVGVLSCEMCDTPH